MIGNYSDDWLTPEQAAGLLGVCTRTLRRWQAKGGAPPVTHLSAGVALYSRAEFDAWRNRRPPAMIPTRLEARGFLAHHHIAIDLAPLTLVCGPNDVGKSAIADAVGFALTGRVPRLPPTTSTAAARRMLVTEGEDGGSVRLTCGDAAIERDVATGKAKPGRGFSIPGRLAALPALIEPGAFARMPAAERRELLAGALGAHATTEAVGAELLKRGHGVIVERDGAHVAELRPELDPAGTVADWHATAKAQASLEAARWRSVTGEAYGTKKAATWQSARRVSDPSESAGMLERLRVEANLARTAYESGEAVATTRTEVERQIREHTIPAHTRKTASARARQLQDDFDRAALLYGLGHAARLGLGCPCCDASLAFDQEAVRLVEGPEPDAEAFTVARSILVAAAAAYEAARVDLEQIAQLIAAGKSLAPPPEDDEPPPDLDKLRSDLDAAVHALACAEEDAIVDEMADSKTEDAMAAHLRAVAWSAMADELAPEGIPGTLLDKAVAPLNDALAAIATETGWKQARITPRMEVEVGGRPMALLSKSLQWRVCAAIAVALAQISGCGLVVLDEFDLLDLPSRGPALKWLLGRVRDGRLASALVLATTKEPPTVPADVRVHWLAAP